MAPNKRAKASSEPPSKVPRFTLERELEQPNPDPHGLPSTIASTSARQTGHLVHKMFEHVQPKPKPMLPPYLSSFFNSRISSSIIKFRDKSVKKVISDQRHEVELVYRFLVCAPVEIAIRIITHMDLTSIGILLAMPPFASHMREIFRLHPDYILSRILRKQHRHVDSVFNGSFPLSQPQRGFLSQRYQDPLPLLAHLAPYHDFGVLIELAVQAISRQFCEMRQTGLIRFYVTRVWRLFGNPHFRSNIHVKEEAWRCFARLPREEQLGIDNFFENLGDCFRRKFKLVAPSWQMHAVGSQGAYRWTLPVRMLEELKHSSVWDLVFKQLAMLDLCELLADMSTWIDNGNRIGRADAERYLTWFESHPQRHGYYARQRGPTIFPVPLFPPQWHRPVAFNFDERTYDLWISGCRQQRVVGTWMPPSSDLLGQLEEALRLPHSEVLDVRSFEINNNIPPPQYGLYLSTYWSWMDWDTDDLGLSRLFGELKVDHA